MSEVHQLRREVKHLRGKVRRDFAEALPPGEQAWHCQCGSKIGVISIPEQEVRFLHKGTAHTVRFAGPGAVSTSCRTCARQGCTVVAPITTLG